jgi:hypothetical protein
MVDFGEALQWHALSLPTGRYVVAELLGISGRFYKKNDEII